jgi:hypothetical protein
LQRISQECNGIAIWCTAVAALERTDSGRADARSLRQRFLGEAGGKPMTSKQTTEGVRIGSVHGAILGRCMPQALSALETQANNGLAGQTKSPISVAGRPRSTLAGDCRWASSTFELCT